MQYVKSLHTALNHMVARRRQLAEDLSKDYDVYKTPGFRAEFIEVQKAIKFIDDAIVDEQRRVQPAPAKGSSGGKDDRYAPIEPGQGYID